jgi:pyridoxine kinase
MNKKAKTAALFHDISCFGRCALSVIVPVVSALGVQPVVVPTALLSTHTGGFEDFSFLDLTGEIKKITAHFEKLGLSPDCVYTGFLGNFEQIEIISDYIKKQKERGACILVDPVMGDDGVLYSSYTEQMQRGMAKLAGLADVITPNMTEAFFLLGKKYEEPPYKKDFAENILCGLFSEFPGIKKAVITGVTLSGGEYGVLYGDGEKTECAKTRRHEKNYPGSGDIFASVLCGKLLNGAKFGEAVLCAADFIDKIMEYTISAETPVREGLIFEKFLRGLSGDA